MAVWEEIVDYTVPSNTTSVTLNNFGTITKDDFIKVIVTSINASSSDGSLFIYPNGNTTQSNYTHQVLAAFGSSVGAARTTGPRIANQEKNNAATTSFSYFKLSENDRFNTFSNSNKRNRSDLTLEYFYSTSHNATFTSGITSLTFQSSVTNGLAANSRIQIYRLTAEKVADITVASNTTQVDITGLNIDKGSEYLLVSDDKANVSHLLYIYPNNLTTSSNYYSQGIRTIDTSVFASRENTPRIHYHDGGQQSLILSNIKISNTSSFITQNEGLRNYGNNSTFRISKNNTSSTYENLSNVTSLKITSSATNGIGANSRFELYKLY